MTFSTLASMDVTDASTLLLAGVVTVPSILVRRWASEGLGKRGWALVAAPLVYVVILVSLAPRAHGALIGALDPTVPVYGDLLYAIIILCVLLGIDLAVAARVLGGFKRGGMTSSRTARVRGWGAVSVFWFGWLGASMPSIALGFPISFHQCSASKLARAIDDGAASYIVYYISVDGTEIRKKKLDGTDYGIVKELANPAGLRSELVVRQCGGTLQLLLCRSVAVKITESEKTCDKCEQIIEVDSEPGSVQSQDGYSYFRATNGASVRVPSRVAPITIRTAQGKMRRYGYVVPIALRWDRVLEVLRWEAISASRVPGKDVLAIQFGIGRILLVDVAHKRVAFLAFGRAPVVVQK